MDPGIFEALNSLRSWAIAGISGVVVWMGRRQVQRIDQLQEDMAHRVTRQEIQDELRALRKEMGDNFRHLNSVITKSREDRP